MGSQPQTDQPGEPALPDLAPRRTALAAERTYLAWLRTSLGALGMALAVGRLLPAVVQTGQFEFRLLGVGYGVLGLFLLFVAAYRARRSQAAIQADAPLPADTWTVWVLSGFGAVLGAATIYLVAIRL